MSKALVLAGGGLAGIAWHLGIISSLRDAGVDLTDADLLVGTSAGSVVATQIATGQLDAAVAMQEKPALAEIYVDVDLASIFSKATELSQGAADETEVLKRFGAYASATKTVPEAQRRAAVAARLPVHEWPERALEIAAVIADAGELVVFDKDSGVELVDAVCASCAVPGVWPPATVEGQLFIDGGVKSFTNADLAEGHERVIIMIPVPPNPLHTERLDRELAVLNAKTLIIQVDADAIAAIGTNPLDPARRQPALDAGRRQGAALVEHVRAFWS